MAATLVRSIKAVSIASGTTLSTVGAWNPSGNAAIGNRIFVYVACTTGAASGVSDGVNTYTKIASNVNGTNNPEVTCWTAVVTTNVALTITVTCSTGQIGFTAEEWSGLDASAGTGCRRETVNGDNGTTNVVQHSGTTSTGTVNGDLALVMVGDWGGGVTWTLQTANGFTKNANASRDADANAGIAVANKVSAGSVAESCIWNAPGSADNTSNWILVIKAASSALLFRSYLTEDGFGHYTLEDNSGILLGEPLDFYAYAKEDGAGRFLLEHGSGVLISEVPDPDVTVFYAYALESSGHFLLEDGSGILISEEPQSSYGAVTGTTAGMGLATGAWGNKLWGSGIWGQWGNALTAKFAVSGTSTGRGLPTGAWGNKIWGAFYAYTLQESDAHFLLEDGTGVLISEQPQPIYGGIWGLWGNALASGLALTGTGAGAGGSTGTLTSADALTGTSQGTGGGSGAISMSSGSTLQVTGTSQGTGGSSATLLSADALTGTAAGTGGSAATLSDSEAVTSIAAGVGGSSATLTAKDAVTSTSAGTGGSTGTLLSADALTGTSQGVGGGSGAITTSGGSVLQVTGTSQGAGGSSAALTDKEAVTSITAGAGGSSVALADKEAVTGSSAGAGGSSGTLKAQAAVSGTGAALGGYSAALKAADTVSGTGSGTSGSSASLSYSVLATLFYPVISREPATAVTSQTKD